MQDYDALKALLEAKEGETVQFKEAKTRFDFEDAGKYCCALANNGGGKGPLCTIQLISRSPL